MGALEQVHQVIAEYDRNHPPENWYDRRTREALEAREAEERKQRERDAMRRSEEERRAANTANNSEDWRHFVEGCIRAWFMRSPNLILDAVGQAMGQQRAELREELRDEFKRAIEEVEAKLAALEERIVQHTNQRIIQHIEQCSERTHALSEVIAMERADRQKEVKAVVEETQRALETKLAATEQRLKAVPGRLPVVKTWGPETVTYEAEVIAHNGALYQARRDTAQTPGGSDWTCVARAGHDGRDGRSPNFRGPYDVRERYAQFDIVSFDGTSFVARKDDPGLCPGDGWQALASRGKPGERGPPGPRGARGARGEPGLSTASWHVDSARYRAVEFLSNGEPGSELNLRALFERFLAEISSE